jgi:hypothetical protein
MSPEAQSQNPMILHRGRELTLMLQNHVILGNQNCEFETL